MDWTPEQIAAACDAYAEQDGQADSYAMRCALSAVDLSDHDRAVAADALRQAADDLEAQKPHIPPSTDPQRSTRVIQRSTLNAAIRRLRARAEEDRP